MKYCNQEPYDGTVCLKLDPGMVSFVFFSFFFFFFFFSFFLPVASDWTSTISAGVLSCCSAAVHVMIMSALTIQRHARGTSLISYRLLRHSAFANEYDVPWRLALVMQCALAINLTPGCKHVILVSFVS